MAPDYLPTQATSIPCERILSSGAETDTTRRNRLSPEMFDALQMLKYDYKLALQGTGEVGFRRGVRRERCGRVDGSPFGHEANPDPLNGVGQSGRR